MTSTRLPGKVLKTVGDRTLLEYQLMRLGRSERSDLVAVATTVNASDDSIVELCARLGVPVHRGSEDDVLERYHGAAEMLDADVIVRVTSDCPLLDPRVVDRVIAEYVDHSDDLDYVSNIQERTYPRGIDCEVFPRRVLDRAFREAGTTAEREHVTPYIYTRPDQFRLRNVAYHRDCSGHRWTVDTIEDFRLIERMLGALVPTSPFFTLEDCLALIEEHPDWSDLNRHIAQKERED